MTSVYDQKTATDMYGNERYATGLATGMQQGREEGREEGMQQGREEGMQQGREEGEIEAFIKIYKGGMINAKDAARMLNIAVEKFLKLAK